MIKKLQHSKIQCSRRLLLTHKLIFYRNFKANNFYLPFLLPPEYYFQKTDNFFNRFFQFLELKLILMKNLHIAIALLVTPICAQAQLMTQVDNKLSGTAAAVSVSVKKNNNETPEQARTQLMSSMNLYRGYTVSVEEIKNNETNEKEETSTEDKANFNSYTAKMEQVLQRRMKALETDNIKDADQLAEKSELIRAFNILKSASCLAERKDGAFVKQKDLSNRDIIAFQLDQLRTNARYGMVEAYNEGYARIKKDQVFGFLNYCGEEVIPCQYETAEAFNNGRALVKKVDWYFTDAKGEESAALFNVVDAKALMYGVSMVRFKNGKYGFIDNKYDITKTPISALYDEIVPFFGKEIFKVREGNKYGLISLQGVVKLESNYDNIDISGASHLYKISQNNKLGLVDTFWKVKFTPEFDMIYEFNSNGIAVCKVGEKFRLISSRTYKSSELYKSVGIFGKNGLANIQDSNGKFGLINSDLTVVVMPMYSSIGEFNEIGLAPACRSEKKCGFINTKGTEVIAPEYEEVGTFSKFGYVVVTEMLKDSKNKAYKTDLVYNNAGQVVVDKMESKEEGIKIHYEILDTLHSDKYVALKNFKNEDLQGFQLINVNNSKLITPTPYQSITSIDVNAILRIKKDNVWGLMDTTGKVIVEPTYSEIRKQGEGFYAVKNDKDQYGFVDKKGKIQIPFEYDDVKSFRNGHCIVTKGKEKWGLINKFNAKIVPLYFKSVVVKDGQYEMTDDKGGIYMIDDKGDCLQNCPKFEELRRKANKQ